MATIHINLGRGVHAKVAIPAISSVGEQVFRERLCTIQEISEAWQLSEDSVSRLFRDEPGVLVFESATKFGNADTRHGEYPISVVERVRQRYEIPARSSRRNA